MAEAMAVVGLGTTLLGGVMQARGQREAGQANAQMYNYQAGVAEINEEISRQNADYARMVGERQAMQFGIGAAQRMGNIKATQSASGLDVNSGSAVDVRKSQKLIDDMSMGEIRSNAAKTAYDYEVQAVQYDNQAELYRAAGRNSVRAAEIASAGTFLGTVSSVATRWSTASQTFGWNIMGGTRGPNSLGGQLAFGN